MPAYDYKCKSCEQTATLAIRLQEEIQIPICSKCKSEMVRDYRFGSVAFRGKGFYSTDK